MLKATKNKNKGRPEKKKPIQLYFTNLTTYDNTFPQKKKKLIIHAPIRPCENV